MKIILQNLFWLTISSKLTLSVDDSKKAIYNISKRLENGQITENDLSDCLAECVDIFHTSRSFLEL